MILGENVINSINQNFRDISSGWLSATDTIYNDTYEYIISQPVSVEGATLLDYRWTVSATTVTIRTDAYSNAPVIWAGYVVLDQDPIISGTGNVSAVDWSIITNVPVASTNTSGVLTSSDWNTFNNTNISLSAYLPLSGGTLTGNLSANNISASTITVGNIDNTEFNYLNGVSANIQNQLSAISATKQNNLTGTANRLLRFTTTTSVGNSNITDSGTLVTIPLPLVVTSAISATSYWSSAWNGSRVAVTGPNKILTESSVSLTEVGYLVGVSANVQYQLSALSASDSLKANASQLTGYLPLSGGVLTGNLSGQNISASTFADSNFVGSKALISNGKTIDESSITSTELSYLFNVSANIQTQLNQLGQLAISGSGAGTTNRLTKFISSAAMGDSSISDNGSLVTFTTPVSSNNSITAPTFTGLASRATSALQTDILKTARTFSISGDVNSSNVPSFDGSGNVVLSATIVSLPWSKISNIPTASTNTSGVLTSSDWNTFNNKVSNLNSLSAYLPLSGGVMTGDITGLASRATSALQSDTLKTSRTFSLSGDINSSNVPTFDGSGNIVLNTTLSAVPWAKVSSVPTATTSTSGVLTSSDWNIFNNKVSSLSALNNYLPISGGTLTGNLSAVNISATTITVGNIDNTEFNYLNGVSANIQTQFNNLSATDSSLSTRLGSYLPLSGGTMAGAIDISTHQLYFVQGNGPRLGRSGDGTSIQINVPTSGSRGFLPGTTSASQNAFLGISSFRWNGTFTEDLESTNPIKISAYSGSKVLVSDASKFVQESSLASSALNYLNAVSADIQTQLGNLSAVSNNKANSSVIISGTSGLIGGGDLTSNRNIGLPLVGTSGTYTKITFDQYGRETAGTTLTSADIPTLPPSKILQDVNNNFVTSSQITYWNSLSAVDINSTSGFLGWNRLSGVPTATTSTSGILTSSDWNIFNNKIGSLSALNNYLPLSGGTLTGQLIGTNISAINISAATITVGNINNTEFNFLDGVSANIQNQLSAISATKQNNITGTANRLLRFSTTATVGNSNITDTGTLVSIPLPLLVTSSVSATQYFSSAWNGDRVSIIGANKAITESSVTTTELSYLAGTSANVQNQLSALSALSQTNYSTTINISAALNQTFTIIHNLNKLQPMVNICDTTNNQEILVSKIYTSTSAFNIVVNSPYSISATVEVNK